MKTLAALKDRLTTHGKEADKDGKDDKGDRDGDKDEPNDKGDRDGDKDEPNDKEEHESDGECMQIFIKTPSSKTITLDVEACVDLVVLDDFVSMDWEYVVTSTVGHAGPQFLRGWRQRTITSLEW
jgi:hypothetical protein